MIIAQNIKVKDRKTLQLVKQHLKAERKVQEHRLETSLEGMRAKWSVEVLAQHFAQRTIPIAMGKAVAALSESLLADDDKAAQNRQSIWKDAMRQAIEMLIPRILQRI